MPENHDNASASAGMREGEKSRYPGFWCVISIPRILYPRFPCGIFPVFAYPLRAGLRRDRSVPLRRREEQFQRTGFVGAKVCSFCPFRAGGHAPDLHCIYYLLGSNLPSPKQVKIRHFLRNFAGNAFSTVKAALHASPFSWHNRFHERVAGKTRRPGLRAYPATETKQRGCRRTSSCRSRW
jgi:hypothetical protein